MSYAILLGLSLLLNLGNIRMLALTLIIGADVFAPIPDQNFYLICGMVDLLVALLAYKLNTNASKPVIRLSAMLIVFHWLGYRFNGYPMASPYHILVKISEHAELLACILLSHKFINKKANNVGK